MAEHILSILFKDLARKLRVDRPNVRVLATGVQNQTLPPERQYTSLVIKQPKAVARRRQITYSVRLQNEEAIKVFVEIAIQPARGRSTSSVRADGSLSLSDPHDIDRFYTRIVTDIDGIDWTSP